MSESANQHPDIETLHGLLAVARAERDTAIAERDHALRNLIACAISVTRTRERDALIKALAAECIRSAKSPQPLPATPIADAARVKPPPVAPPAVAADPWLLERDAAEREEALVREA